MEQGKNQEKVTDNHKTKKSLEADPEMLPILELAKDFKITIINI